MDGIIPRVIAAALLSLCASCATEPGQRAEALTAQDFARVVVNQSTASEVRALLGPPARDLTLRAQQGHTWGYRHGGTYNARMFWVVFSPDGVAREVSDTPDFEADKRYRGP